MPNHKSLKQMKHLLIAYLLCCQVVLFAQIGKNGLPTADSIIVYELKNLNSKFRDVNISITPNGRYLYFMSSRGNAPWTSGISRVFKGQTEYDGDIWFSTKKDTLWQNPVVLPNTINTSSAEDEPNVSADGQTVYFQSWHFGWQRDGGPYYRAELYGTNWQNPVGMGSGINQFFRDSITYHGGYATDGMAISPNGNIFLVVAGVRYDGNLDIYISRKDSQGKWSYPKRLPVSTNGDERSIFIAGDNQTIYFGSNGRGGSGRLDIFKALLQNDNTCTNILNIGEPFNTNQDDYGFIIGAQGTDAYFVRNDDIYYAQVGTNANLIKPKRTIVIDGIVKDCTGKERQSNIILYNSATNERLATARSNAVTGEYSIAFPYQEGTYLQRFTFSNDDTVIERTLNITPETPDLFKLLITPDCLPPAPIDTIKSLLPTSMMVYFDFDQYDLKPSERRRLDSLVTTLDTSYRYQIQLIGHTDSIGTDKYNMILSKNRTASIASYFSTLATKVNAEITYKGEALPLLPNNSTVNRAKNRRVEIQIVPIESNLPRLNK